MKSRHHSFKIILMITVLSFLWTYQSVAAPEPKTDVILQRAEQLIEDIGESLDSSQESLNQAMEAMDPNRQHSDFAPMVEKLEKMFQKDGALQAFVNSNLALQHYFNLIHNHILHISLTNRILPFENLAHMYPHDLPYTHEGPYPILPTRQVLDKVRLFFLVLTREISIDSLDENFDRRKIQSLTEFHEKMIQHGLGLSPDQWDKELLKTFHNKGWVPKNITSVKQITADFVNSGDTNHHYNAVEIYLKTMKFKEALVLEEITNQPKEKWMNFRDRILDQGLNASFQKEFEPLVETLTMSVLTSLEIEAALAIEPQLNILKENALNTLNSIRGSDYGYRETVDGVLKVSEFFDIVQRANGEGVNPLHYAWRYQYYMYYILAESPDHISIPSTLHFKTYDLLSIAGAPLGLVGVSTKTLWVDSYLQTSNEFALHDGANHERRRYQFTKNYGARLGLHKDQFSELIDYLSDVNSSKILPLIQRIDRKDSAAFSKSDGIETFFSDFTQRIPERRYFEKETQELRAELDSLAEENIAGVDLEKRLSKLNDRYRIKINRRKTLYDMILFEVIHEDALPPSPSLIVESLRRRPNLPMPRDFIDPDSKEAFHSMEPAGSTIAYILNKLNGSFYDTPRKRLLAVAAPEYRSPKSIIEATVNLIMIFDKSKKLERDQVLEEVVLLTISEEGFLSYLLDEFQRDLHPIQRDLLRSHTFAEGLETLSLINEFASDNKFIEYKKMVQKRIDAFQDLSIESDDKAVEKLRLRVEAEEKVRPWSFEELDRHFMKLGLNTYDRLYAKLNQVKSDDIRNMSILEIENQIQEFLAARAHILENLTPENFPELEKLTFQVEKFKELAIFVQYEQMRITGFVNIYRDRWNVSLIDNIDRGELAARLTEFVHNDFWLVNFRKYNGLRAKYHDLPSSLYQPNESPKNLVRRLESEGYIGLRLGADGNAQQNINMKSNQILPELYQSLTEDIIREYTSLLYSSIDQGKSLSEELIYELAERIHHLFMETGKGKIAKAFAKLDKDVHELSTYKIVQIIQDMDASQWKQMTALEIASLKQYAPFEDLKATEKNNDINMAMAIVGESIKLSTLNHFAQSYRSLWSQVSTAQPVKDEVAKKLQPKMHNEIWRISFNSEFPGKPHYIAVPENAAQRFDGRTQAFNAQNNPGLRKNEAGEWEQDINRPFHLLVPELAQRLAGNISEAYVDVVFEALAANRALTPQLLEELGLVIKETWMNENLWQVRPLIQRIHPSAKLDSFKDAQEEISRFQKSEWLEFDDREVRKLYQFDPSKGRGWSEGVKNLKIVLSIVEFAAKEMLAREKPVVISSDCSPTLIKKK